MKTNPEALKILRDGLMKLPLILYEAAKAGGEEAAQTALKRWKQEQIQKRAALAPTTKELSR